MGPAPHELVDDGCRFLRREGRVDGGVRRPGVLNPYRAMGLGQSADPRSLQYYAVTVSSGAELIHRHDLLREARVDFLSDACCVDDRTINEAERVGA
jgi:hypothetical protein